MDDLARDPEIHKALLRIAHQIRARAIRNIIDNGTTFSGDLARSITVVDKPGVVLVGSDLPYAPHVEFGTLPHMPPVKPFEEWVRLKLGVDKKEANSVAWAVAMKIKREGTPPQPFFRPAIDSVKNLLYNPPFLE